VNSAEPALVPREGGLQVLELLGPSTGGIRSHVAALSARLPEWGWSPRVAAPPGVMDRLWPTAAVVAVPESSDPGALAGAVKACRSVAAGCAVVHAHGLKAALVAKLATRKPLVVTVHNSVIAETSGRLAPLLRRIERWLVRHCDRLIVISEEMERELGLAADDPRVRRIYPVSEPRYPQRGRHEVRAGYGIAEEAPLVVCVARLHPQKDLDMLLEATNLVREEVEGLRVLIVGDGPQRTHLEDRTAALGLEEVVTFAGARPWPMDEMAAADAVALSSVWEGSPIAAVEALRLGAPLVTTAVGSLPEYLVDGENCRMVRPRDVQGFASALAWVIRHPAEAGALGEAGRVVADELFSPDKLTRSVAEVYQEVSGGGRL
jgi:glycosyltransferase involved in cell wall biosynthesis